MTDFLPSIHGTLDIDYGNEDENNENGDGNHEDADPYGYNAHFASMNQGTRGSRSGGHRRGQHGDQGSHDNDCFV